MDTRSVRAAYRGELVVPAVLADRRETLGERVFVSDPAAGRVTYAELCERAERFAGGLLAAGVRPGDRVATMLNASVDYLTAIYGIAWAGAVDVPLGPALRGQILHDIVADSEPTALIVEPDLLERFGAAELAVVPMVVEAGPAARRADGVTLAQLLESDPVAPARLAESDMAQIIYTSGTTGRSKGVVHSHRSALRNSVTAAGLLELTGEDVAYSYFPLSHITARTFVVGSTLLTGGSVVLRPRFSASAFWSDVVGHDVTWFPAMGSVLQILVAAEPSRLDRAHRVRRVCAGAAPAALVERFERRFGSDVWDVYGMTEIGTLSAPVPDRPKRPGATGPVVGPFELELHDERDRPVPDGAVGEIVVRPTEPNAMFLGYWRQDAATVAALRNCWFHTGDAGRLDEEGNLWFVDRLKDSIRRRGENVSAYEVERAVLTLDAVVECAAYGVTSEYTEQDVAIAVVVKPGLELAAEELLAHCIAELPRYAVPRYIRFVAELPRNASERIQKAVLREQGVTSDTLDRETLGVELPRN